MELNEFQIKIKSTKNDNIHFKRLPIFDNV